MRTLRNPHLRRGATDRHGMYTVSPATSSHVDYAGDGLESEQTRIRLYYLARAMFRAIAVPRRASTVAGRQLVGATQRVRGPLLICWLALNGMNSTAIDHHPVQASLTKQKASCVSWCFTPSRVQTRPTSEARLCRTSILSTVGFYQERAAWRSTRRI